MAGKAHLVGHHQHRAAFLGQAAHDSQHFAGQLRVKSRRGFVKINNLRVCGHGAGNRHALLLPAGKLVGVVVGTVGHAHPDQRGAGDLIGLPARHFPRHDQPLGDVLQGRFVGEQVVVLEHEPGASAQGVDLGTGHMGQLHALAVKGHRAVVCLLQKVQAAQHRGFSAAACTQNGDHVALVHVQVNAFQHL